MAGETPLLISVSGLNQFMKGALMDVLLATNEKITMTEAALAVVDVGILSRGHCLFIGLFAYGMNQGDHDGGIILGLSRDTLILGLHL